ncbi:MAG: hypothetical protein JW860_08470 [Sedimentisphaerales bacterium]|nr:hypothetical protein [Sedimentisphaerales bacterium]
MIKDKLPVFIFFSFVLFTASLWAEANNEEEPVRFIGDVKVSSSDYKNGYHDGQMPVAIGVQNYQIMRANRTHPEWSDGLGWTYNHAPMLAYTNGQFYCQYLTNPSGEHIPPGMTLLTRSADGKHWRKPQVLFPIYFTADPKDASITFKFMHQRMGFYMAPNGRFLTMAFYGSPYGDGVGRVVREIYPDDSFGPIYFIRVNDNWTGEVKYPLYTAANDPGFVEACRSFLDDKIRRMQWWEEDFHAKDRDDFYRVTWGGDIGRSKPAKAFCFYTRPDGAVVGFFKSRWVTMTRDQGQTWSPLVQCKTLTYGGAKIWAQRLDNGQYALVYNPTNSMARHPLCITTSDDGVVYDHLANIHSEVPVKRFWGREKRPGAQYVRGIIEGNGNPPDDDLWVVYSVNKEDIWISRIPIPVQWQVQGPVHDDFSQMATGGVIEGWNIYSPQWSPVEIVEFPGKTEKSMRLKDADPYDYAKAVRVFQKSSNLTLSFDLYVESCVEVLDIEIVTVKGNRLIQTRIDTNRQLLVKNESQPYQIAKLLNAGQWYTLGFQVDASQRRFSVQLDGDSIIKDGSFSASEGLPERIIFRTGPYRLTDDVQKYKSGSESIPGTDEPGADEPVETAVYYIKDFQAIGSEPSVLKPEAFRHYVDDFNTMEKENIVNEISNAESWAWMKDNIPFFECPDKAIEQIYYYRWWTFRKHLKKTPEGYVFTEFLDKVGHSGKYNTISCALGHHICEGTWLRDSNYIDQYARFWYTGNKGAAQPHFHKYSNWATAALYRRYLVNQDKAFLTGLLDAFVRDYQAWVDEKGLNNGLFWQYDVRDGMEESISGSRKIKNARPPLNCYMFANAIAIAKIAEMAGDRKLAQEYAQKAADLKSLIQELMWDDKAAFFKVRHPEGTLATVREEIGYIPWYFNLPDNGYEKAWQQLTDPQGFKSPMGITTAERRHPEFRSHGVGTCEWDGAVWPFATSQTLTAMANLLRNYEQPYVNKKDYFEALRAYARSHHYDNKPYIGEYLDEINGRWLTPDSDRSRYYNHSTFCDLVITGPVGLAPRADDIVEVDPLLPDGTWDWFCLDMVLYHGKKLTILWDRTGEKYGKDKGFRVFADGQEIGYAHEPSHLKVRSQ